MNIKGIGRGGGISDKENGRSRVIEGVIGGELKAQYIVGVGDGCGRSHIQRK